MRIYVYFVSLAAVATFAPVAVQAAPVPTMCAKADKPVFSCPIKDTGKTASLCAAGNVEDDTATYYYAYGRDAAKPELKYPEKAMPGQMPFTRTHLTFGGNTGGFAYAFVNGGYKYVLYSISGSEGHEDQGLIVQKDGETKALKRSACESSTAMTSDDRAVIRATRKWPVDDAIDKLGLPDTH